MGNYVDNPAPDAGAFAGAASSAYVSGLHFAQALRAAAAQQQQHAQQQQQKTMKDQFDAELKMRKEGYVPYMVPGATESSGLKRRDVNPAAEGADPSRIVSDPYGRKWLAPGAKPDGTPQQAYSDTMRAMDAHGQAVTDGNLHQMTTVPRFSVGEDGAMTDTGKTGVNVPVPDQRRVVTPPGGKQGYYIPTDEEKAATTLQEKLTAAAATPGTPHIDTEHFSSPMLIDPKSGKATAIQLPDGVTHNDKPGKAEKFTYNHFTDDNGKVTVTRIGEEGTPERWDGKVWAPLEGGAAVGPKRRDPSMTPGQSAVERRFDQRERDSGQQQIGVIENAETKAHAARHGYGQLAATKDGETVVDPDTKREVKMSPAWRTRFKQKYDEATQEVDKLGARKVDILHRFGGLPADVKWIPGVGLSNQARPSTGGGRGAPANPYAPAAGAAANPYR